MLKKIKDININYIQYGKGPDVILLHGWGQNIQMMEPLGNYLQENHRITIVDFPGFGMSEEPKVIWTIYDYVEMLEMLVRELDISNPTLIGHSFGGRVSIIYGSRNKINRMVLLGSPCVRHENNSKKTKLLKKLKSIKGLSWLAELMKKYIGSEDYRNATPMMRNVLVNTINEDLKEYAKKIKCPTLLIWGRNDMVVPISQAKELDELIKDSALIILEGTHYCYLENLNQVINVLNNFI